MHKSGFRGLACSAWIAGSPIADLSRVAEAGPSRQAGALSRRKHPWSRALVSVAVAAVGSISLLVVGGLTALPASASTGAPSVTQCNPPDFPTGAGFQVTCTVSVENYTSSSGATSSTVTTSACLAVAGVVYPSCPLNLGPVTSTTTSTQLVTSVNQCNGVVTGGGSNVYCNVEITNNVPAATGTSGVSINQCNGSVTGAGGTVACAPTGSTTNATVDQCDDSVTGGGTYAGEPTAGCTVTGTSSADPVTVNQCNGTATGGGSAVTCAATFANVFAPATPSGSSGPAGPLEPVAAREAVIRAPQVDSLEAAERRRRERAARRAPLAESPVHPAPLLRSFRPAPRKLASADRPGPLTRPSCTWDSWPWLEPA